MDPLPPAAELTAHQPPALLVDHVISTNADGGQVAIAAGRGLDALHCCEAAAQAVAVITGAQLREGEGGARAEGMLVGAKGLNCHAPLAADCAATVHATRTHSLGPVQLWQVRIVDAHGRELLDGELKVAQREAST